MKSIWELVVRFEEIDPRDRDPTGIELVKNS